MTITTKDGQTIEVDAPIVLPEGDTLPTVLVQSATFDMTDLYDVYPLPKHIPRSDVDHPGEISMSLKAEEKPDILTGKWGATTRASLLQGEKPPENDVTVDEIMAFIYENIERFDCDGTPDIRVLNATAKSGLYRIKEVKGKNRWPDYVIDETKPVKGASKGAWNLELAQYSHGTQIFEDYFPYGGYEIPPNPNYWYLHQGFHVDYMDESNFNIAIVPLKEIDIIMSDTPLLSYETLVQTLTTRMQEGKLRSIYSLTLGYTVKIVKGDAFWNESNDFSIDTRYVLVPEWKILGFDEKSVSEAKSFGIDVPTKDMILEDNGYELRMDASTGKFNLSHESMEYVLEQ